MANFKLSDLENAKGGLKDNAYLMIVQDGKNYKTTISDIVSKSSGADLSEIKGEVNTNTETINKLKDRIETLSTSVGNLASVVLDPSDNPTDEFNAADMGASLTSTGDVSLPISTENGVIEQNITSGTIYQKVQAIGSGVISHEGQNTIVPVLDRNGSTSTVVLPSGKTEQIPNTTIAQYKPETIVVVKEVEILPTSITNDKLNDLMGVFGW